MHGGFGAARCMRCSTRRPIDTVEGAIKRGEIPKRCRCVSFPVVTILLKDLII